MVPQAHQPNDGEVALAVGGEYRHAALTLNHLVMEGRAWGLTEVTDRAMDTLTAVLHLAHAEVPDDRAYSGLASDISRFTSNLLAGRVIGPSNQHRLTVMPYGRGA